MSSGTFVSVPADALVALLEEVGGKVEAAGGKFSRLGAGREVVFEIRPPSAGVIRVYTSVAAGASEARARGEDALRVVVGYLEGPGVLAGKGYATRAEGAAFRPLGKARRVFRTAPRGLDPGSRVSAFLARLTVVLREAYAEALQVRACPRCGRAMVLRQGSRGQFWGCTGYPSACRETRGVSEGGGVEPSQKDADSDTGDGDDSGYDAPGYDFHHDAGDR